VKQSAQKDNGQRNDKAKGKANAKAAPEPPTSKLKRKHAATPKDDAPRAFKRLMAYAGGKKPRSGLDNGDEPRGAKGKKRNAAEQAKDSEAEVKPVVKTPVKPAAEIPTIRPGERMSEFSARVDAALPLAGLVNKSMNGNKDPLGLKVWRTNKEMKMHKMYDEWREQERKMKEKHEEELELQAEKELEEEETGISWKLNIGEQVSGKRKGKGKTNNGFDEDWEILRKKRGETRPGLHDVALAPPTFTAKPRQLLGVVRGAAVEVNDIPKSAGSLKRREELQAIRNDVVAAYRRKMEEKRLSLHIS
jgi:hypothetical protein